MNILIHGVNYTNKGAELMLHAVNQQVVDWNIENRCCLPLKRGSFKQRNNSGVGHLLWVESEKYLLTNKNLNLISKKIPHNILKKGNFFSDAEIDVVLDASGFCFSDQWGDEATEIRVKRFIEWKKKGKKIVLLPQAFGPFTTDRIRESFRKIIDCADLIFARDIISFNHIKQVVNSTDNVFMAPDFTNLVRAQQPSYIEKVANKPCIIPNCRMIDKADNKSQSKYIDFLIYTIDYLNQKDLNPFLLIHDTGDLKLIDLINNNVSIKIPIVQENNSLFIKSILGRSSFVIGSRYHGLISSLSQSVPCIGTGWSHKYEELFKDYDCLDFLVDSQGNLNQVKHLIDNLIDKNHFDDHAHKINARAIEQKEISLNMWKKVKQVLNY